MSGAQSRLELVHRVVNCLPLRVPAPRFVAELLQALAHRDQNAGTPDVAMARYDDPRFESLKSFENRNPTVAVDVGVLRREEGRDREAGVFGEVSGEENAL